MKESEIKISEYRFLELKQSENRVPLLLKALLTEMVADLKKQYPFQTEKEREILGNHLLEKYRRYNLGIEVWFNNSYNSLLMFRYNAEEYFVEVAEINPATGEALPE